MGNSISFEEFVQSCTVSSKISGTKSFKAQPQNLSMQNSYSEHRNFHIVKQPSREQRPDVSKGV